VWADLFSSASENKKGMGSGFYIEFLATPKALSYRVHLPIELHPISIHLHNPILKIPHKSRL